MINLMYVFITFITYSFIGYLVEIIYVSIESKKLVFNRGFLLGPWLPIYGVGSILLITFLESYKNDILVLYGMGMLICSIVEFITSYILEKIFKVRWWDYSDRKYNIDGRICLFNSILFGVGGVVIVGIVEPFYEGLLRNINPTILMIVTFIIFLIFICDLITSISVLFNLKNKVNNFNKEDNTEEIKRMIYLKLVKHNYLFKRLLNAFPNIEGRKSMELVEFKKMILRIRDTGNGMKSSITKEIRNLSSSNRYKK